MATLAVTGAHGKTGQAVIRACGGAWDVRALARNEKQARNLEVMGCDVVIGDMTDTETLQALFKDAHSAYHICPNFHEGEVEIGASVAAHAEELEHLVYHSVLHPQTQKMPHHWRKLLVEEILLEAKSPNITFVRSAPYVQNLKPYIESALKDGVLALPYSVHARTAMVDLLDVGRAVKVLLSGETEAGSGWDLCGVGSISHQQIADLLTTLTGAAVKASEVVVPAGTPDEIQMMFDYMDRYGLEGSTAQLRSLLGELTPVATTVQRLIDEIESSES
ncbi:MAG: NmrA family NAD(P)-binding protein [Actinomycetota bacterium]|nr:NmrA family NAD(P)-binding protein [Actinomycetota bacterium]